MAFRAFRSDQKCKRSELDRNDKKLWEVDYFTLCFRRVAFGTVRRGQKCRNMYYNINVQSLTELIKSCGKLIILPCIFERWLSERSDRVRSVENAL